MYVCFQRSQTATFYCPYNLRFVNLLVIKLIRGKTRIKNTDHTIENAYLNNGKMR